MDWNIILQVILCLFLALVGVLIVFRMYFLLKERRDPLRAFLPKIIEPKRILIKQGHDEVWVEKLVEDAKHEKRSLELG
jgi:hypothetical protein